MPQKFGLGVYVQPTASKHRRHFCF